MPLIQGIEKSFGPQRVLRGVTFALPEPGITCLMGPSGGGKTTLLRILLGLERADAGHLEGLEPGRLGAVFQEDRLCEGFSALENVALVCRRQPELTRHIARHLDLVGLAGAGEQPVRELSGGMRRRVALVRAVLSGRPVLLLDEPFKGLDEETRAAAAAYLRAHTAGRCLLLVTHDEDEVALMGGNLLRLENGRVIPDQC